MELKILNMEQKRLEKSVKINYDKLESVEHLLCLLFNLATIS